MWDHCGVCLFFYCHACELANAFILYFMVNYSFTQQHLAGVFYFYVSLAADGGGQMAI